MRTKLSKIAHILLILIIGAIGVQTMISCSGDDGGGDPSSSSRGGSSSSSSIILCDTPTYAVLTPCEGGTVAIGDQVWQKCNSNAVPSTGNSACYDNKESNCEIYGRFYNWEAAMSVCTTGWHIPTKDEWKALTIYIDSDKGCTTGSGCAAKHLKAASGWNDRPDCTSGNGTDAYGFSALPGGRDRGSVGLVGSWWSSSDYPGNSNAASCSNMYSVYEWIGGGLGDFCGKSTLHSVRCIQD